MLALTILIEWIIFVGTLLILISYIIWNTHIILRQHVYQDNEKISVYECGFLPFSSARIQFDIKYFIIAILFLLFDLEIAWIFPFAVNIELFGYYGLIVMLKFLLILFLGLCYEISSNVLNWSYQRKTSRILTKLLVLYIPTDNIIIDNVHKIFCEVKVNYFIEKITNNLFFIYIITISLFFIYLLYINQQQNNNSRFHVIKLYRYLILLIYSFLTLSFWHVLKITPETFYFFNSKYANLPFNIEIFNLFFVGIFVKLLITMVIITNCIYLRKQITFLIQIIFLCLLFVPISNELVLTLLAFETTNMCIYGILLFFSNRNFTLQLFRRIETCIKYFCLSSVFTGMFLGFILFSTILFNNTTLTQIYYSLIETSLLLKKQHFFSIIILFAFLFAFIFFKLAAFPNHWWAPDVYEGSSIIVFGIFAIFVKTAIFSYFYQLVYFIFYDWITLFIGWILFSSLGSLFFGAIGALNQKNIRRFLAYTSMHHVGFIFLSLIPGVVANVSATTFYFISYIIALMIFYLIYGVTMVNRFKVMTYLSELNGFNLLKSPLFPIILVISFASMGGFPPLIGFFGKYFVFSDLLVNWHIILFFSAVLTSVISAYNYLKIISLLVFKQEKTFVNNFHFFAFSKIDNWELISYSSKVQLISHLFIHNIDKLLYLLLLSTYGLFAFPSQDWVLFKNCF